jgi:hypothetical protein
MVQESNRKKVEAKIVERNKIPKVQLTFEEGDKFDKEILQKFADKLVTILNKENLDKSKKFFLDRSISSEVMMRTIKLLGKMYFNGYFSNENLMSNEDDDWQKEKKIKEILKANREFPEIAKADFDDWEKKNSDTVFRLVFNKLKDEIFEAGESVSSSRWESLNKVRNILKKYNSEIRDFLMQNFPKPEDEQGLTAKEIKKAREEYEEKFKNIFQFIDFSNQNYGDKVDKKGNKKYELINLDKILEAVEVSPDDKETIGGILTKLKGETGYSHLNDVVQVAATQTETLRSKPKDIPSWSIEKVTEIEKDIPKMQRVLLDFTKQLKEWGESYAAFCNMFGTRLQNFLLDQSIINKKGKVDASRAENSVDYSFKINMYLVLKDRDIIREETEEDGNTKVVLNKLELRRQIKAYLLQEKLKRIEERIKNSTPKEGETSEEFDDLMSRKFAIISDMRNERILQDFGEKDSYERGQYYSTFIEALSSRMKSGALPIEPVEIQAEIEKQNISEITRKEKLEQEYLYSQKKERVYSAQIKLKNIVDAFSNKKTDFDFIMNKKSDVSYSEEEFLNLEISELTENPPFNLDKISEVISKIANLRKEISDTSKSVKEEDIPEDMKDSYAVQSRRAWVLYEKLGEMQRKIFKSLLAARQSTKQETQTVAPSVVVDENIVEKVEDNSELENLKSELTKKNQEIESLKKEMADRAKISEIIVALVFDIIQNTMGEKFEEDKVIGSVLAALSDLEGKKSPEDVLEELKKVAGINNQEQN